MRAWGAEREGETNANAREKRNKGVENNEGPATRSQDTNYKSLGSGATTATGSSPASVRTTAITTTINPLSGSSAPWFAHGPLTTLLLGLNEDPDVPSTFSLDPDTTLTTLS